MLLAASGKGASTKILSHYSAGERNTGRKKIRMAQIRSSDEQHDRKRRIMSEGEQQFLRELDKEIGRHPNKQDIMAEYELHVYELLKESQVDEENIYRELEARLRRPKDIAALWKQDKAVTPSKMQWLFALCNRAIFAL